MQLVVVNAVAAAVMAATITFNSTSQKRLLFISIFNFQLSIINCQLSSHVFKVPFAQQQGLANVIPRHRINT